MFGILKDIRNKESMKKSFDEYKEQCPELSNDVDWGTAASLYAQWQYEGAATTESPINFDTLNAITKNFYSPEARVERMMQHAKIAAEKGSWWCSIPEVGEKEIELLKQRGLRVFKKTVDNTERSQIYEEPPYLVKYSINWSDKNTTPHDKTLVEL